MKILICRTCGCSLARLGISNDKAITYCHDGKEHYFCCQGCVDLFVENPVKYLQETNDLIICPTCLAEKPRKWATKLNFAGQEIYFCRCPHCAEVFQKNPDFYINRLEGIIPNKGVLDHDGCCIRPD